MSEIFISYARATTAEAEAVAEALQALGHRVWRDDELPAHRGYAEVIAERLASAKAVVVVWSAEAARSQWVQSEADRARADGKLVQLTVDGAPLPMPFDRIQCADLTGWTGDTQAPGWLKVAASVADLTRGAGEIAPKNGSAPPLRERSICVLPFANMSGDSEQEYFSDGVSEDIITDLAKVSALFVVSRNSAFRFKGHHVDLPKVARELNVSHVLEGSVRKASGRVRITAQLIDGATGGHVWAERWDRDLTDIFAVQDEISEAIVAALKLKLLPEEKQAIERRGTTSVDAYSLYLMARRHYVTGNQCDVRPNEAIIRLCRRATEIDPNYARAWALMALAQTWMFTIHGAPGDEALATAERALALDPDLAEAHAVVAKHLNQAGRHEEALARMDIALGLDPECYEVNETAGTLFYQRRRLEAAARHFEKATALMDTDFGSPGMLMGCYIALGDSEGAHRTASIALARAEQAVTDDPGNGTAIGFVVAALAILGEAKQAKDRIGRALHLGLDSSMMRYNFACTLNTQLSEPDGALELLGPFFAETSQGMINHARTDPDLDTLRNDPRFQAMLAAAEARLDGAGDHGVRTSEKV